VKKSNPNEHSQSVQPGQGRFAACLQTGMHEKGFTNAAQVAEKLGISREHVRKLLSNEAQPSKPLTMAIARLIGFKEEQLWAAAQEDRLERKFGHALMAKSQGKNPRIAQFEAYLLALTEEQVPAAIAMLQGLTSSGRKNVRPAFTMDVSSKPVTKAKEA
jgi:transcriptional regulator with XRE-family HTH domain